MGPQTRQSRGLEQFFYNLRDTQGQSILDLGGATQANILYITSLGHRLATEDMVASLDAYLSDPVVRGHEDDPHLVKEFVDQTLNFVQSDFGGALVWDTLQYLSPPILEAVVRRLHHAMRPGASLLAFFHADDRAPVVPLYSYRIQDARTLGLADRGARQRAQFFNNRGLERLFQDFESIKFFLTRDSLREILVRR